MLNYNTKKFKIKEKSVNNSFKFYLEHGGTVYSLHTSDMFIINVETTLLNKYRAEPLI